MQKKILEKMSCPVCKNDKLEIYSFSDCNALVVKDGILYCKECKTIYTIINKLLELLPIGLVDAKARDLFFQKYEKNIFKLDIKDKEDEKNNNINYEQQIKQQKHFDHCANDGEENYSDYENL